MAKPFKATIVNPEIFTPNRLTLLGVFIVNSKNLTLISNNILLAVFQ